MKEIYDKNNFFYWFLANFCLFPTIDQKLEEFKVQQCWNSRSCQLWFGIFFFATATTINIDHHKAFISGLSLKPYSTKASGKKGLSQMSSKQQVYIRSGLKVKFRIYLYLLIVNNPQYQNEPGRRVFGPWFKPWSLFSSCRWAQTISWRS